MFIASKYKDMLAPEIGDFVHITDRAYTKSLIREIEIKNPRHLGFELGHLLPLHSQTERLEMSKTPPSLKIKGHCQIDHSKSSS